MKNQEQIVKDIYAALHIAKMTWTMTRNKSGQVIIDFYNNHIDMILHPFLTYLDLMAYHVPLNQYQEYK